MALPTWFIDAALVLVLVAGALLLLKFTTWILGSELSHYWSFLRSEFSDARAGKKSVGAMNWKGFVYCLAFGVLVIVASTFQKVVGLVASVLGQDLARELVRYTNYVTIFGFLLLFLAFSLIVVGLVEQRPKK